MRESFTRMRADLVKIVDAFNKKKEKLSSSQHSTIFNNYNELLQQVRQILRFKESESDIMEDLRLFREIFQQPELLSFEKYKQDVQKFCLNLGPTNTKNVSSFPTLGPRAEIQDLALYVTEVEEANRWVIDSTLTSNLLIYGLEGNSATGNGSFGEFKQNPFRIYGSIGLTDQVTKWRWEYEMDEELIGWFGITWDEKVGKVGSSSEKFAGVSSQGYPQGMSPQLTKSPYKTRNQNEVICVFDGFSRTFKVIIGSKVYAWNNICLLYTSPSPRDGLLSRMPSSA
eukprot:TRINITY_DN1388_c0_g1_i13.p1 TRINITY_DN1388_c0_g1~~TRINITY_DN1388_c0_g1_i13.p1  ORF type:complete len:284 (-),score=37.94 TRINITY_DN1388_c0_g1_i13:39-890(-)